MAKTPTHQGPELMYIWAILGSYSILQHSIAAIMKKILKVILWSFLSLVVLLVIAFSLFVYKIKNGFPVSYETEKPILNIPIDKPAILLFSKSTGFRHAGSIDTGKLVFADLAKRNHWEIYETESGGVFNPEQLKRFKVVIFNNSTGRVLNDEQQKALEDYVENGGSLMGIHGAGDDSHHWPWYEANLLGGKFSHHAIKMQLQDADVMMDQGADSGFKKTLSHQWHNADEWYVFFNQPKGFQVLYYIDGEKIDPSGNILFVKDKNFGMGKKHPVAWYKSTGKGKSFYTSMGHSEEVWRRMDYVKMIEAAVNWELTN
jgi:type 1 glutamine amidotransferase